MNNHVAQEYEQAKAQYKLATLEIQRLEHEVFDMQQEYNTISSAHVGVEIDATTEQERMRLVKQFSAVIREREYWLDVQRDAAQTIRRERERLVHELRSDIQDGKVQIAQAATPEVRAAMQVQYDQASQQLQRVQQDAHEQRQV
jgi:hypothetical protein